MNPFSKHAEKTIVSIGESKLISNMSQWLGDISPPSPAGIGDDCAVITLPKSGKQLATVDPIVYGKHFDDKIGPSEAAAKLIRRNASDIASMGGCPNFALVSLSLPSNVRLDWLEVFYRSLALESKQFGIQISGGDLGNNDDQHLSATLSLLGWIPEEANVLLRKKGNAGDSVFVTGSLGGSILEKHYSFTPRLAEGQFLADQTKTVSCLDLSDGLGKDATQLASPNCTVVIDANQIPVSRDANTIAAQTGKSPLHHAINDGEDYELLFSISPQEESILTEKWTSQFKTSLSKIGYIRHKEQREDLDIELINNPQNIELLGYEHLR